MPRVVTKCIECGFMEYAYAPDYFKIEYGDAYRYHCGCPICSKNDLFTVKEIHEVIPIDLQGETA